MGALKVWDGTAWQTVGTAGTPGANVYVAPSAPPGTPSGGDLWYDTDEVAGLVLPLTLVNGGTGGASAATARSSLAVPAMGSAATAGAPTTGTWTRGDQWLDSNNVLWLCTAAGTPGTWVSKNQGEELVHVENTTSVGLTNTAQASSHLVVDSGTRSYDGGPIIVEFYSSCVQAPGGAGQATLIGLYDGASYLGYLADVYPGGSSGVASPVLARRRITPTPGTHNYRIGAWMSAGTGGIVHAGTAAGGTFSPVYLRVTRA